MLLVTDRIKGDKVYYIHEPKLVDSNPGRAYEMSVADNPVKTGNGSGTRTLASSSSSLSSSSAAKAGVASSESDRAAIATAEKFRFDVSLLVPSLCVDITMMLTVGLASPLLSVVIACSVITNVFLFRLALGRYMGIVSKALGTGACHELLESAFGDQWRCLSSSWWLMSIFIGMFWALFVNDMVGDANPTGGIIAAVMMMILCPVVFISLQRLLYINPDTHTSSTGSSSRNSGSSSSMSRLRYGVHEIALWVHTSIWKKVFQASIICSSSSSSNDDGGSNSSSSDSRGSLTVVVAETVTPLASVNRITI